MWGTVFACLLHHSLCRCHMCWIEFFTPTGESTHTCIPVPPSNLPRQRKAVLSEFSHAGSQGTRSAKSTTNTRNQTTTISKHLLVSNWVKAFFNFRYGEPSWRSNNAHAILRCQGNTIIHTVHVMNACAPRALTSCNERINDKHGWTVPHSHTHERQWLRFNVVYWHTVVTQRCRHLDAAFKLGGI